MEVDGTLAQSFECLNVFCGNEALHFLFQLKSDLSSFTFWKYTIKFPNLRRIIRVYQVKASLD